MEIKQSGKMLGLFSSSFYGKGDVVLKISGPLLDHPVQSSIQIGPNKHVDVDTPAKFINHSCKPNTKVEGEQIVAINTILPGEEITFDYQGNEYDLAVSFICRDCGQWVKGMKYKGENVCLQAFEQKIMETQ
ncbi:MAG: SET domain-containing protein-lysine N-methyltransferase [Bacteroidetes bacterium]|nr:SET domain-containing protein-lysine N-methyltransferase [Bacteroidota bacterium]